VKIAVSGLNNTDNPSPGIPVIKSLLENHQVIGLSYDTNEPGNYMGLSQKVFLMPYPSLGYEELKKRLQDIKNETDIEALIPNLDAELPLYIKHQDEFEQMGIKLCLPSLENFKLSNKKRLGGLSKELGIKYPKTYEVSSQEELTKVVDTLEYPIMVKGNYYKAYKVSNLDLAIDSFYQISNEWGFPVLVQEVVDGEELNLVGVGNGKGELSGAVAIKKLTTTSLGKIWTGITIQNQKLMQIAQKFVAYTKWKGPFELECIANHQEIYMIEINPRFPAWVHFATDIGVNLPQMVVEIMQDKTVKPVLEYPSNKMYVRYTGELVTDFTDFLKLFSQKEL